MRPAPDGPARSTSAPTRSTSPRRSSISPCAGISRSPNCRRRGWFGASDWQLTRLKAPDAALLEYERIVLEACSIRRHARKLSDLKNKFYDDLAKAKKALYADAVERGWFPRNPNTVRTSGVSPASSACQRWRRADDLSRDALGRGARRPAGHRRRICCSRWSPARCRDARPRAARRCAARSASRATSGRPRPRQQEFAERANIFTELPAVRDRVQVRGPVGARVQGHRPAAATAGWYAGSSRFNAAPSRRASAAFSSSVSSTIASTPGGSGSSGFSGGSSGGGGGGGGGRQLVMRRRLGSAMGVTLHRAIVADCRDRRRHALQRPRAARASACARRGARSTCSCSGARRSSRISSRRVKGYAAYERDTMRRSSRRGARLGGRDRPRAAAQANAS